MSRNEHFDKGRTGHDAHCMMHAETVVREEMHKDLTAPAWDHEAMERENAMVTQTAKDWLDSGTKDCQCRGS